MKKLKLPDGKNMASKEKIFSMDEYLKFVEFNLKYVFDKKAHAVWKRLQEVNVPFRLID